MLLKRPGVFVNQARWAVNRLRPSTLDGAARTAHSNGGSASSGGIAQPTSRVRRQAKAPRNIG